MLLYASYGLLIGFHTLAFWKTMPRLGTVPVAVSKGRQQALTKALTSSCRTSFPATSPATTLNYSVVNGWRECQRQHALRRARRAVVAPAEVALVLLLHGGHRALCAAQADAGKSELQHERHRDGALGRHSARRIRVNTRWSKGTSN